ncbi:hypothetical protein LOK49_LG06G01781 [Camellia lanceoleosa]|uniref:Uncharacterized protein n=1 Tax=Camellia lanceoleosa TaxID=1840588 RepID=A0ACC0HDF6_9ERIC|nr:hypothetical protein LOK49_LG06G01781 [Camellia lanceoleosa]
MVRGRVTARGRGDWHAAIDEVYERDESSDEGKVSASGELSGFLYGMFQFHDCWRPPSQSSTSLFVDYPRRVRGRGAMAFLEYGIPDSPEMVVELMQKTGASESVPQKSIHDFSVQIARVRRLISAHKKGRFLLSTLLPNVG